LEEYKRRRRRDKEEAAYERELEDTIDGVPHLDQEFRRVHRDVGPAFYLKAYGGDTARARAKAEKLAEEMDSKRKVKF